MQRRAGWLFKSFSLQIKESVFAAQSKVEEDRSETIGIALLF